MCAISGLDGLKPTLNAIEFSKKVAIANKESLVCAWDLIERDRPAIVFEHTDTYYETPLEVRKHISSQFQSLNYEIYLLCQGRKIFDYKFLEHIDFGEAPFIDGDLLATPLEN